MDRLRSVSRVPSVLAIWVLVCAALVSCSAETPSPSPMARSTLPATPGPDPTVSSLPIQDAALWFENRGGPAFTIYINDNGIATVACDGGTKLVPYIDQAPPLPWQLTVIRDRDGSTLYSKQITQLPAWSVQIGDQFLGVSDKPILGPAGPTCPSELP